MLAGEHEACYENVEVKETEFQHQNFTREKSYPEYWKNEQFLSKYVGVILQIWL